VVEHGWQNTHKGAHSNSSQIQEKAMTPDPSGPSNTAGVSETKSKDKSDSTGAARTGMDKPENDKEHTNPKPTTKKVGGLIGSKWAQ
jgi:hypothetical protein